MQFFEENHCHVKKYVYLWGEFQVLLRVGVRFNGSNLIKKSDWILLMFESGQFNYLFNSRQYARIIRIIVPIKGILYSKVWTIVCYKQIGSPEP